MLLAPGPACRECRLDAAIDLSLRMLPWVVFSGGSADCPTLDVSPLRQGKLAIGFPCPGEHQIDDPLGRESVAIRIPRSQAAGVCSPVFEQRRNAMHDSIVIRAYQFRRSGLDGF